MAHQRRRPLARGPRRRHDRRAGPGRHVPVRRRAPCSGPCRGSCGAPGPRPSSTRTGACTQALNCLLVETPAGRVLIETGIGERMDDKNRRHARLRGPAHRAQAARGRLRPGVRGRGGDEPPPLRPRRRAAPGRRDEGVPAGEDRRPARGVGDRAVAATRRVVASYDQPELRLVADWGAEGWTEGDRELLPGVSVVRPAATPPGTRRSSCAGPGPGARTVAFFGDLAMRPWSANPRWVTLVRRLPARLRGGQGRAVPAGRRGRLDRRALARGA